MSVRWKKNKSLWKLTSWHWSWCANYSITNNEVTFFHLTLGVFRDPIEDLHESETVRSRSSWCYYEVWWPSEETDSNCSRGDGPSLLGQDWLKQLHLYWTQIFMVKTLSRLEVMIQEYAELFPDKLGTVKYFKASLKFNDSPQPKFFWPWLVTFEIWDVIGHWTRSYWITKSHREDLPL